MRFRTLAFRILLSCASLLASLVMAELVVARLRDNAFPHLNIFQHDATFGVVLQPHAEARLRTRGGRITTIRTNSRGFRGPEWSTNRESVLLLGDSQVFGYGVDEQETAWSQLTAMGGTQVLPAAIPTWGPAESVVIASQLIPEFRPRQVVFVANLANDWFEAPVPNARRTTAVDGWPSRITSSVRETTDFPFRTWLLGKSHLVYAVRRITQRAAPELTSDAARRIKGELPQLLKGTPPHRSRLTPHLQAIKDLCASHGCSLLTLILPLDVQVHPEAWRKYRGPPVETSDIAVLTQHLSEDAHGLGIPTVDLLPILTAASPGTFLPDNDHLSATGHQAIARTLARHLSLDVAEATP